MKRTLVVILTLLMLFTLLASFISCEPKPEDSKVITFMRAGIDKKDESTLYGRIALDYEKENDATVKIISSTFDNHVEKIITQAAAGRPIDVIFAGSELFPLYVNKGYVQAMNKYIDLSNEALNIPAMDATYRYDGKYYLATAITNSHFWCIFYNKDMFDREGLDDPGELYKKDNWNFNTFKNILVTMKEDVNGDGVYEKFGFGGWGVHNIIYGNAAAFISRDEKGLLKPNHKSQALINGLELYKSLWLEELLNINGTNDSEFLAENSAMYIEREFMAGAYGKRTKDGTMPFEWGVVPLPYGPENTEKLNFSYSDGYSIGNKCRNPVGAGKYIGYLLRRVYEDDLSHIEDYPEEVKEMYDGIRKKVVPIDNLNSPLYAAEYEKVISTILSEVVSSSVTSVLDSYANILQQACDETNEKAILPVARDFTNFYENFDDNTAGIFTINSKYAEVVSSDTVKTEGKQNDELFDKYSLKVSITDGSTETLEILSTDASKNNVAGWREYNLSFDYKFLEKNTGTGKLYVKLVTEEGIEFCKTVIPNDDPGYVNSFKVNMSGINTNAEKIRLVIVAEKVNAVLAFDNFAMEEYNSDNQ